ncbi:MAG: HDOD domain-containing protein [Sedimenticola sp.]
MENFFIGRQAIYDRRMQVFAYELLYRNTDGKLTEIKNGDQASSQVILNALSDIGLERLVGDNKAFFNLTRNLFMDEVPLPLDTSKVVLEILEMTEVDEALVNRVRDLNLDDYSIAIDNYTFQKKWEPLLPYVDIIKIEVSLIDWPTLEASLEPLHRRGVKLLAKKVENADDYERLFDMGIGYFQGNFFARPTVIKGQRLEDNRQVALRLMTAISDPKATNRDLEQLIIQDSSLSFRILRHLNSMATGMPRKVDSIGQAIVYLGRRQIQSWANLIALSAIGTVPCEILNTTMIRAHMCSQLLIENRQAHFKESGFMAGLMSNLDILMDEPMGQVLAKLPLKDEIHDALLKGEGPVGDALKCAVAYDKQEWDSISYSNFEAKQISEIYLSASDRAFKEHAALFQ